MSEQKTTRRGRKSGLACVSLALLFLIMAGYGLWAGRCWMAQQQQKWAEQSNALLALESRVASLEAQQKIMSDSLKDTQRLSSRKKRDWVLAEVHYLLNLAQFNVQFRHNIPVTIQLLTAADHRLQSINDPTFLALRKAMAADRQRLRSTMVVDVPGLLVKIQALSKSVSQLPLLPPGVITATPSAVAAPQKTEETSQGWRGAWQKTVKQLRGLIIIEKDNGLSAEALVPIQHGYDNLYVQTLLTQLQWAVLQGDDGFYQATLQNIEGYVAAHYLQSSEAIEGLHKTLADLRTVHVNQAYPDIKETEAALKAAMDNGSPQHD